MSNQTNDYLDEYGYSQKDFGTLTVDSKVPLIKLQNMYPEIYGAQKPIDNHYQRRRQEYKEPSLLKKILSLFLPI